MDPLEDTLEELDDATDENRNQSRIMKQESKPPTYSKSKLRPVSKLPLFSSGMTSQASTSPETKEKETSPAVSRLPALSRIPRHGAGPPTKVKPVIKPSQISPPASSIHQELLEFTIPDVPGDKSMDFNDSLAAGHNTMTRIPTPPHSPASQKGKYSPVTITQETSQLPKYNVSDQSFFGKSTMMKIPTPPQSPKKISNEKGKSPVAQVVEISEDSSDLENDISIARDPVDVEYIPFEDTLKEDPAPVDGTIPKDDDSGSHTLIRSAVAENCHATPFYTAPDEPEMPLEVSDTRRQSDEDTSDDESSQNPDDLSDNSVESVLCTPVPIDPVVEPVTPTSNGVLPAKPDDDPVTGLGNSPPARYSMDTPQALPTCDISTQTDPRDTTHNVKLQECLLALSLCTLLAATLIGMFFAYHENIKHLEAENLKQSFQTLLDQIQGDSIAFSARHPDGDLGPVNTNSILSFSTVSVNLGGAYDGSTYKFRAPVDGVYQLSYSFRSYGGHVHMVVDGRPVSGSVGTNSGNYDMTVSFNDVLALELGQEVWLELLADPAHRIQCGNEQCVFTGILLSRSENN